MCIGEGYAPFINMPSYVHKTEENIVAGFVWQITGLHAASLCDFVKI
jgi:hypothetical protein